MRATEYCRVESPLYFSALRSTGGIVLHPLDQGLRGHGAGIVVCLRFLSLRLRAMLMMARTIAASSGSLTMSRTKDWSILSLSTAKRLR